jgi:hypothetical protein
MANNWRPGPEVPRAHHFEAAFCDNVDCGLHIIARHIDGSAICEIVMSPGQTLAVMDVCKDNLYSKAVRKDDI